MTRITTETLDKFLRTSIGFGDMLSMLTATDISLKSDNYPPYDIVEIDDNTYEINFAVAGFIMNELKVTQDVKCLIISATNSRDDDESHTYLHKGIAMRDFIRKFTLADHVNVHAVNLQHGVLSVTLKREVPEELKPKTFSINTHD